MGAMLLSKIVGFLLGGFEFQARYAFLGLTTKGHSALLRQGGGRNIVVVGYIVLISCL